MNRREFSLSAAAGAGAVAMMSSEAAMAKTDSKPVMSLNVVYVSHEGARFDYDYYRKTHIPHAMKVMKADKVILTEGVSSPDKPAPIAMICRFEFSSPEALAASGAAPGIADVRADVAKFTDIKPIVMAGKTV